MMDTKRQSSVVFTAMVLASAICLMTAVPCQAQSGSAQLSISLTVQSSISLIFQNNPSVGTPGFCPLTNPNTNAVGLDLGSASFPGGATLACVNYTHLTASFYQVSSAFDVVVTKANTGSPNYRLARQNSTAPPVNVIWLINHIQLTNTALTTLAVADTYSSAVSKTPPLPVRNNVSPALLPETTTSLAPPTTVQSSVQCTT